MADETETVPNRTSNNVEISMKIFLITPSGVIVLPSRGRAYEHYSSATPLSLVTIVAEGHILSSSLWYAVFGIRFSIKIHTPLG